MTLEQLRIFVAVAEREHMTRGAEAVHLTQSATSAAIAALEARSATRLFDRVGRGIALTETGRLFLTEARAVLARAAAADAVLADLAGLQRGALRLGASQTVGNYWLPGLIHRYRLRYPGIATSLVIGNTAHVATLVRDGLCDLGFVEGAVDDPQIAPAPAAEDGMLLVTAPAHPWATAPPSGPEALREARWVVREAGSGTRAVFAATLATLGVDMAQCRNTLELPSNEAIRTAVEVGAGATILSRLVVAGSLRAGLLAAVKVALPSRRFDVLRHRERHVSKAQEAFLGLVREADVVDAAADLGFGL